MPFTFSSLFLPSPEANPWVIYIIYFNFVCSGLGLSVAYLLPWSMLPDVIDAHFRKTGKKIDTLFYSFYVFFNKLATGVALAVSQLLLRSARSSLFFLF